MRLVDRFVMPSSVPICPSSLMTSREIGAQTTFSSLPSMSRSICRPQRCASPAPRAGYRRLLNGTANSAVHPSSVSTPADANSTFHDRSPGPAALAAAAAPVPPLATSASPCTPYPLIANR